MKANHPHESTWMGALGGVFDRAGQSRAASDALSPRTVLYAVRHGRMEVP
jgi:hypothetical protein